MVQVIEADRRAGYIFQKVGSVENSKIRGMNRRTSGTGWLSDLVQWIRDQFSRRCDVAQVDRSKQEPGEAVEKYLNRLTEVCNEFSGQMQPEQLGDPAIQISTFRNGMLPELSKTVTRSCVEVEKALLAEVHRHAVHAEKFLLHHGHSGHWAKQCLENGRRCRQNFNPHSRDNQRLGPDKEAQRGPERTSERGPERASPRATEGKRWSG